MFGGQKPCWLGLVITAHLISCSQVQRPIIAIDIGHSYAKPGATSSQGHHEFGFNLALGQVLQALLKDKPIHTMMIGERGNLLRLSPRTTLAKQFGARFFLSLHHDSVQPHYLQTWQWQGRAQHYTDQFSGFSLFVSRKNPHLMASLQCASAIGSALQAQGFHPTDHHAEPIKGENKSWADQSNGVYYYDDLFVLKTAMMPSVLLEAGVIVNRQEERQLQQPKTYQRMANAIVDGLIRCRII